MARKNAAQIYAGRIKDARNSIERLTQLIDRHEAEQKKRPRDWGYVGDMGHICNGLDDVLEGFEEECFEPEGDENDG